MDEIARGKILMRYGAVIPMHMQLKTLMWKEIFISIYVNELKDSIIRESITN